MGASIVVFSTSETSWGQPTFEASMVRGEGDKAFWTSVGAAYQQEGYISILLEVVPTGGKIILTVPREQA